jgi:hypothetical protein
MNKLLDVYETLSEETQEVEENKSNEEEKIL